MARFGLNSRFDGALGMHHRPNPGPIYNLPSCFDSATKHAKPPVDKAKLRRLKKQGFTHNQHKWAEQKKKNKKRPVSSRSARGRKGRGKGEDPVEAVKLEHPESISRAGWLQTSVRCSPGPAYYRPKDKVDNNSRKRVSDFSYAKRSNYRQYMGKEMMQHNLCRESPGPKYQPNDKITKKSKPAPTFNVTGHKSFFANTSTNNRIGPGSYQSHTSSLGKTTGGASRAVLAKACRFSGTRNISYLQKKHNNIRMGVFSPGPKYSSDYNSISSNTKHNSKAKIRRMFLQRQYANNHTSRSTSRPSTSAGVLNRSSRGGSRSARERSAFSRTM